MTRLTPNGRSRFAGLTVLSAMIRPGAVLRFALMGLTLSMLTLSAAAQEPDDESEFTRVRRDQSRVSSRLPALREKMERLASRYEDEGRTRNATLLREAIDRFDSEELLPLVKEVERSLEDKKLSTIELQDRLLVSIEGIYSVLRDRRDVEDLEDQSALARQGAVELGFLAESQRRLLSETRALTDQPDELLSEALELAQEVQAQLESAESSLQTLEAVESALGEASLADMLARQQRALAAETTPDADAQGLLQAQLEMLRERLETPLEAGRGELAQATEAARSRAAESATRAAERMAAAREALETAESGSSGEPSESGQPSEAGEPRDGGPSSTTGESGEPSDSGAQGESGEQGESSEPSASSETGESSESGASGEQSPSGEQGAAGEPSDSGEQSPAGEQGSAGEPNPSGSQGPSGESNPAGESPEESPAFPDDSAEVAEAREAMTEAAEALEQVRAQLDEAERAATAARNREQSMALATSRDAGNEAEQLEDRAERLEALQPEEGPELLNRTRDLLRELSELTPALERGDTEQAAESQQQAAIDLAALMQMLQQRSGAAEASEQPEVQQEQLDQLAAQQEELQAQLRQLMDRLAELPDQEFRPAMERAAEAMDQASESLQSGESGEAQTREEEAAEELEQAQKELAEDRDRYEQLRQEEVLFKIAEELGAMRLSQEAINVETLGVEEGREDGSRLGRSQRRSVSRLSATQSDLVQQTSAVRAALAEDGAVSFVYALDQVARDMGRSSELLAEERTDFLVQSVQSDIVRRIDDLIVVLEKEDERRRDAFMSQQQGEQESQPSDPNQNTVSPLVPKVAELYLIQRLEQSALARLENFERLNPEIFDEDSYSEVDRELIERWAYEHSRVSELFRELVPETPTGPEAENDLVAPRDDPPVDDPPVDDPSIDTPPQEEPK